METILQYFAFLFITLVVTATLTQWMKSKHFKVCQRVTVPLMGLISTGLFLAGWENEPAWVIRGVAFALILLYASVQDITCRKADNYLWIMILTLAVTNIGRVPAWSMVLGVFVVLLPQVAMNTFGRKDGIGGADVKLSTASAVLLGFAPGAIGYMAGLFIAVIASLIYNKIRRKDNSEPIPLLPYLSVGLMLGYMITIGG